MADLEALALRCEAATGPDDTLDMDIAYWCYKNGAVAGINYDPAIYMVRHGWSPTASIDAAMMLVPQEWRPNLIFDDRPRCYLHQGGNETIGSRLTGWRHYADAATMPLAITSAALRARASVAEPTDALTKDPTP